MAAGRADSCLRGVKKKTAEAETDSAPRSWEWVIVWLVLLVLPGLAAGRLSLRHDIAWAVIGAAVVSGVVLLLYALDKRRAQTQGAERVPESGLHALELLGGWPGAFVAQRMLRHKNAKLGYQMKFWLIVAVWQLVSLDLLLGWRLWAALWSN